eukprot:273647-Amphidinium_carterae.1
MEPKVGGVQIELQATLWTPMCLLHCEDIAHLKERSQCGYLRSVLRQVCMEKRPSVPSHNARDGRAHGDKQRLVLANVRSRFQGPPS